MFCCKLMAYGISPLAVDFWLSAKHIWGSRFELLGASSSSIVACKGSLVEPLGAKWRPKAAKEDPKADTERPKVAKVRPDVDHKAPSNEKSRKKLSEAWPQAAQNHEICFFSQVFVYFIESPWHVALALMAYGIMAICHRNLAVCLMS